MAFYLGSCRCRQGNTGTPEWWPPEFGPGWGTGDPFGARRFEWGIRLTRPVDAVVEEVWMHNMRGRGAAAGRLLEPTPGPGINGGGFTLTWFGSVQGIPEFILYGLTVPVLIALGGVRVPAISLDGLWPDSIGNVPNGIVSGFTGPPAYPSGRTASGSCQAFPNESSWYVSLPRASGQSQFYPPFTALPVGGAWKFGFRLIMAVR